MRTILATLIGSIHVLAAAALVGGALYSKVVMPRAVSPLDPQTVGRVNEAAGRTFTIIVWGALGILLLTGLARAAAIGALRPEVLFASTYGAVLLAKIAMFLVGTVNAYVILTTGAALSDKGKSGADAQVMGALSARMSMLQTIGVSAGAIIIILAVALRVIGVPEAA